MDSQNERAGARRVGVRDGVVVLLAYAVMALADCLGVLSSRTGLVGVSSTLFFVWFAVLPLPVGILCGRAGACRVLRMALGATALACALMGAGSLSPRYAFAGFCLAGLANVGIQVAVPVFVAERFSPVLLAGVVTMGLFAKTLVAVVVPFAVSASAERGCWWLSLVPFALLSASACFAAGGPMCGVGCKREPRAGAFPSFGRVLKDPVVCGATVAFAVAIVADVVFNLSVPGMVSRRFGGAGATVGVVYAVWFGVKLPLMLLGTRLFLLHDARRFFVWAALVSLAGAVVMLACDGWRAHLVGVGLLAAGFANVYGHVFGAAAPRHPNETSAVSSLLVMAISAGALASPLLAAVGGWGSRASEGLVLALVALLLPLSAFLGLSRNKP